MNQLTGLYLRLVQNIALGERFAYQSSVTKLKCKGTLTTINNVCTNLHTTAMTIMSHSNDIIGITF